MYPVIPPPATSLWYDPAATLAEVQAVLRLTVGDVDSTRLEACIPRAAGLIDQHLDQPEAWSGLAPEPVQGALVEVSVELYQRASDGAAFPADRATAAMWGDPLRAVYATLMPYKRRWGVA